MTRKKPLVHPPTISIIIPTLNEEKFLPLLLADLSLQTARDFEVVIVDGGSQDATLKKAAGLAKYLPKLVIVASDQAHVAHQRNLGSQQTQSQWLIFMDADNRIAPTFMEHILAQIAQHPQVNLFTCWIDPLAYRSIDRPLIHLANIGLELYSRLKPMAPGALIGAQRQVVAKVLFDEKLTLSEDHQFVIDATQQGYIFKVFREPRYVFSLRRFKRDGTLKMLRVYAQAQLLLLTGQKVTDPLMTYPMDGGGRYDKNEIASFLPAIEDLPAMFVSTSKIQLNQAKKILRSFKGKFI